jgi:hypothetical protein
VAIPTYLIIAHAGDSKVAMVSPSAALYLTAMCIWFAMCSGLWDQLGSWWTWIKNWYRKMQRAAWTVGRKPSLSGHWSSSATQNSLDLGNKYTYGHTRFEFLMRCKGRCLCPNSIWEVWLEMHPHTSCMHNTVMHARGAGVRVARKQFQCRVIKNCQISRNTKMSYSYLFKYIIIGDTGALVHP